VRAKRTAAARFAPVTSCMRLAILGIDSPSKTPCVIWLAMSRRFHAMSLATLTDGFGR
jgi:hypothetical protein